MSKLCIKCGYFGHTNRVCKGPVTSFGLVIFADNTINLKTGRLYPFVKTECKYHEELHPVDYKKNVGENDSGDKNHMSGNEIMFLLVERKDTVGFLSLVQGSYPDMEPFRSRKIVKYINELTCEERLKFKDWSFENLWKIAGSEKRDYGKAEVRFKMLDITTWMDKSPCFYQEADYLMPKGRLKYGETLQQCALREFSEETGYKQRDVELLNFAPFEENFIGTDGKSYRNVFFVAKLRNNADIAVKLGDDPNQSKEVRNIGWFNISECCYLIRDYHQEKKKILKHVHDVVVNRNVANVVNGKSFIHNNLRSGNVYYHNSRFNPYTQTIQNDNTCNVMRC